MLDGKKLAKATIWGTAWNYASYYSGRLIGFASLLILARVLSKDDFGVAAFATVIMGLLDEIAGLGIGQAVIFYREEPDMASTAFWMNVVSGLFVCGAMWWMAPLVGLMFGDARAVPVVRAFAFLYPLSSLEYIHSTLLQKRLSFGRKFIPDIMSAIGKACISIPMALLGFGAWSLIIGQLGSKVVSVTAYWMG
jgi:O-antigen/teichoic acid export membrane protein